VLLIKSIEEFEEYYNSYLKSVIKPIEEERIKLVSKISNFTILSAFIGIAVFIFFVLFTFIFSIFVMLAYISIISRIRNTMTLNYKSYFKDVIIQSIVQFSLENIEYHKSAFITRDEIKNSKLFTEFNRIAQL
jgi:hypothetical protein